MASVTAFNEMMGQFLMELHKTFPEEKGLKKCLSAFDLMKESNPKLVVDGFMASVTPFADKISAKDDTFFINELSLNNELFFCSSTDSWYFIIAMKFSSPFGLTG